MNITGDDVITTDATAVQFGDNVDCHGIMMMGPNFTSHSSLLPQSVEANRLLNVLFEANISNWTTRFLIFIRGLPGSGKTTLARFFVKSLKNFIVASIDDYFCGSSTQNIARLVDELDLALAACKQKVWTAIRTGVYVIIVDNCNLEASDMEPYIAEALKYNYSIHFMEPNTPWRYDPKRLLNYTRKCFNLTDLERMLFRFDRVLTPEQLMAQLNSRSNRSSKLCNIDNTKFNFISSKELNIPRQECEEETDESFFTPLGSPNTKAKQLGNPAQHPAESVDTPSTSAIAQYRSNECQQSTLNAGSKLETLKSIFPNVQKSTLKEFLDLAHDDLEWASLLILESKSTDILIHQSATQETSLSTALTDPETNTFELSKHSADLILSNCEHLSLHETNLSSTLAMCNDEQAEFTMVNKCEPSPPSRFKLTLSREFLQHAHEYYAYSMGLTAVDLSPEILPDFILEDWSPEPKLVQAIYTSFLHYLGVLPYSAYNIDPKHTNKRKSLNSAQPGRNSHFLNIMNEEEAIHRSIEDYRESLGAPAISRIVARLVSKFPGTQRSVIEEEFVRSDFNEYETESKLTQRYKLNESDVSIREVSNQPTLHGPPIEENLTLQEIQDEEEAINRSINDHKFHLQTLANQLCLSRLKSQFPGMSIDHLENLFITFDFNEQNLVSFLKSQGYQPRKVGPLIAEDTRLISDQDVTNEEVTCDKNLPRMQMQLNEIRKNITNTKLKVSTHTDNHVKQFYLSELRRLQAELNDASLEYGEHLVNLRSAKVEQELISAGEKSVIAAKKALAFLDLHAINKPCALHLLRQRLFYLKSTSQSNKTSTYIPSYFVVITGRAAGSEADLVPGAPILRNAVMQFLQANRFDFEEKYRPNSGYFIIRLKSV